MDSSEVAARRGFYPAGGQGERGDEGERRGDEGRTAGSIAATPEVQRGPPAAFLEVLAKTLREDARGGEGETEGIFFFLRGNCGYLFSR